MLRTFVNTCMLPSKIRSCPIYQQIRNTFVLNRRYPIIFSKKGGRPKRFKQKHYVYDLVENTECRKQGNIKLILTQFVEGLGDRGEVVSVKPLYGRQQLLLPGLAVYASPENLEFGGKKSEKPTYSSHFASKTIGYLSTRLVSVSMNRENPWTLEPWHIRVAFRKVGIIVPEEAIELPIQPISGPDMDKEDKEFAVFITINKTERVPVRCKIHHWSPNYLERNDVGEYWKPSEPILPEQATLLSEMPRFDKSKDST
ncbi:39S ribosomal protein L9, mitochondrial-like [Limulus polyphemus]|uniref:Large ribosomal subunit protein bL9m n=1 Tax=Limulus polyphemus TaxID=6850 RepID=A0ABM1TML4_LIMPO|nr:39S ribosomal protein L9, mitochondrial-like [Limulus polyphemus]